MRLRRRKNATEILINDFSKYVIETPEINKGKWLDVLGGEKLHVEFGAGKGQFVTTKAINNPGISYVAVEKEPEVLIRTAEKAMSKLPENLKLLNYDVNMIEEVFGEIEVDRIYLNFSDPWPKNRHAKRRLTYHTFLDKYEKILKDQGEIHFKTDNRLLFEFSLNEFAAAGWTMKNISLNYMPAEDSGDVATEYEEKFRALGQEIYRLEAFKK